MTGVEQIDDPELSSGFHEKIGQKRQDQIEYATTADRILGLLQEEPISVKLTDTVSLDFYPPTDEQFIDVVALQGDGAQIAARIQRLGLKPGTTDEEANEMIPQAMGLINQAKDMLMSINELLAVLSVDKAWTPDKFKQLPKKYKQKIISEIVGKQGRDIKKPRSSRKVIGA